MATERDVYQIDASQAVESMDKVARSLSKTFEEAEQAKGAFQEMGDMFARDLQQSIFSATAAYDMLAKSLGAVKDFVVNGAHAFIEAEQANMRLSVALKNVGGASEGLIRSLQAQNSTIQRATGIDDDYLTGLQAMLTTMGVAPEMLGRFTTAAVNLAQATGQDAKVAAQQLARANAEGREDLRRYGIELEDADFKARGFAVVLEEVERRFGGIADQQPEIVKQTNALKGAWSDFSEAVGEAAIKLTQFGQDGGAVVSFIDTLTAKLKNANVQGIALKGWLPALLNPALAVPGLVAAAGDFFGTEVPKESPVPPSDFSPAKSPIIHLPGFNPDELKKKQKETEKLHTKALDDRKRYREEMERISAESGANLQKMEEAQEKATRDRILKSNDWEERAEEERVRQNFQAAQDYIEAMKWEEEQARAIRDRQREETKAFWMGVTNDAKAAIESLVSQNLGFVREMLLANTEYNRQVMELELQRRTAGMSEAEVQKERAKMEKQLAQERGAAYLKMTADALASIAQQAGVKAVMESVEAIAAAATGNVAGAAMHGTAAAGYAGVAVLAGGGAAILSSARGMTTEERKSLEAAKMSADKDRTDRRTAQAGERKQEAATIVNVYNLGITGQTEVEQAKELERIRSKFADMRTGSGA